MASATVFFAIARQVATLSFCTQLCVCACGIRWVRLSRCAVGLPSPVSSGVLTMLVLVRGITGVTLPCGARLACLPPQVLAFPTWWCFASTSSAFRFLAVRGWQSLPPLVLAFS